MPSTTLATQYEPDNTVHKGKPNIPNTGAHLCVSTKHRCVSFSVSERTNKKRHFVLGIKKTYILR